MAKSKKNRRLQPKLNSGNAKRGIKISVPTEQEKKVAVDKVQEWLRTTARNFKFWRIAATLMVLLALLLVLNRVRTRNFSLIVSDASQVSMSVRPDHDTLKSPLCSCTSPVPNNFGFLQFFKEISFRNGTDTASFSISAPDDGDYVQAPAQQFSAEVYLFEKDIDGIYEVDSFFARAIRNSPEVIRKAQLDSLYFISIINRGIMKAKFLSENCISAFLPGQNSKVTFLRNSDKYSRNANSIDLKYSANYNNQQPQLAYFELFGPKVAFFAPDVIDLIGQRGKLFFGPKYSFDSLYKNSAVVVIVDVPYTARITFSPWSKAHLQGWYSDFITQRFGDTFPMVMFFDHVPFALYKSRSSPPQDFIPYSFEKDPSAMFGPAVAYHAMDHIGISLKDPLSPEEFAMLKKRCMKNGQIFKNPRYEKGMVFKNITPYLLKDSGNVELGKLLLESEEEGYFENFKKKASKVQELVIKYGYEVGEPILGTVVPVIYYFPTIPDRNAIYFFGNADELTFEDASLKYSYGLTGNQEFDDCSVRFNEVRLTRDSAFYTEIPIKYFDGEPDKKFKMRASGDMYINDSRAGDRIINSPFIQSLGFILSISGFGVFSLIRSIRINRRNKLAVGSSEESPGL